jgi:hypothetical protein
MAYDRSMSSSARRMWLEQDRNQGDRRLFFRSIAEALPVRSVLYPGSYVDIGPSFVFPSITYVDSDRRAPAFFADTQGILEIIGEQAGAPDAPEFAFVHGDYTEDLALPHASYDLLVSLYAGFVSEYCTCYLRVGGMLLVNSSHGDAAMASIDPRYRLWAAVASRKGGHRVTRAGIDSYLVPKRATNVTKELLHRTRRGIAYTKSPAAYLFERVL